MRHTLRVPPDHWWDGYVDSPPDLRYPRPLLQARPRPNLQVVRRLRREPRRRRDRWGQTPTRSLMGLAGGGLGGKTHTPPPPAPPKPRTPDPPTRGGLGTRKRGAAPRAAGAI